MVDRDGKDIAEIHQGSSQIYGIVTAKNPGEVTVLATVYNKVASGLGPVIGSVTCKIQVVFAVDTSQNDNVFKKPYEDSQDKAIFLRTTDKPVPLTLNYGSSSEAQWTVANSEVADVSATGCRYAKGSRYDEDHGDVYAKGQSGDYLFDDDRCIRLSEYQ